ncbi:MAG: hypothetical protein JWM43_1647 [Acidobacteriaceae bacterium]|nr:hypothetical protein [Acidobacteriaceae bacterium]
MPPATRRISTDIWAVVLSLALALVARLGLLKSVPW